MNENFCSMTTLLSQQLENLTKKKLNELNYNSSNTIHNDSCYNKAHSIIID